MKLLSASVGMALLLLSPLARGEEVPPTKSSEAPVDQATLDKEFVETMTGAVLVGKFTILDQPVDTGPKPDKYTITKVEKKEGNTWLFIARVEYERGTYPVALKIPVVWAGRTPVISVTDLEIPLVGPGKFQARVLIDGDRYAGTWAHDKVGGHMYGRIERPKPKDASPSSPDS